MKKTLALLLCAASMLALLAGCGSKSTDDKAPAANGGETASTEKADYPTSPITVIIPYSPGGGCERGRRFRLHRRYAGVQLQE